MKPYPPWIGSVENESVSDLFCKMGYSKSNKKEKKGLLKIKFRIRSFEDYLNVVGCFFVGSFLSSI
jgi:hypothetical protein